MRLRNALLLLGLMALAGLYGGVVAAPARASAVARSEGPPPTTLLSSSPAAPNGDSQWFRGAAPLITLTASDSGGSATTTYYSWDRDPGAPGPGWSLYAGTLTAHSGTHTLYYYSSDAAGDVERAQNQVFNVDDGITPPKVSTPTGVESSPTPVRGTIACDSIVSDDLSGVDILSFWVFGRSAAGWNGVGTQVGLDQAVPFAGMTYRALWDTTGIGDGFYKLQSQLRDVAGNTAWSEPRYVEVDNIGPAAAIIEPVAGRAIGGSSPIIGTVDDPNLAGWTLQLREVGAGSWNTVASGRSPVVGGTLSTLDTGGYPQGSYQLQLVATDVSGNTSIDLVAPFAIDTTKPSVVSAVATGRTLVDVVFSEDLAPESIDRAHFTITDLTVTAAALQADKRTVALSTSGQSAGAPYEVSIIAVSSTVADLAGNVVGPSNSASFEGISVDSTPPTVPTGVTAASGHDKNHIAWTAVLDPDVEGYNVYRASSAGGAFSAPINPAPLTTTAFTDASYGSPGVYYYRVSSVDTAGNVSEKSAAIAAETVSMSETVGGAGATLVSSTGEVKIEIPAGTLSGPIPLQVVESARPANRGQFTFASPAYEFLPAGQTFLSEVSITVAYEPGSLDEATMRLVYDRAGQWTSADVVTMVDEANDRLTGRVKHFSEFAAASADVTPPMVSSVTPADAATGVSVADFVTVVFDEPMDPSTLNNDTMQIRSGGVTGTPISLEAVVFSADKSTAYLYPERMLDIETTYGVWVSGAKITDLAGNPSGTDFTSTFATASVGVSPHDGYADSTNLCRNCHAVHGAAGPTLFVEEGERLVCYTCHDGTGSSYNAKTTDNTSSPYAWDFGEAAIGTTSKISYHPVPKASTTVPVTGVTMQCSNCHNAHSMTGTGARFLAPKGLDPDPAKRGSYAAQTGNAFCFTCHNTSATLSAGYISTESWNTSTGFDHKSYYPTDDSGHSKPVMAQNPTVPSKEGIACKGCHSEHGTTNDKLIAEQVNGQPASFKSGSDVEYNAYYNPLCLACHIEPALGGSYWPGSIVYSSSGHGTSAVTKTLAYAPNDAAGTMLLQVKLCKQCHEPHGAGDAANAKAYPNLTRLFEENVCYRCHGSTANPTGAKNIQTEFAAANSHDLGLSTNAIRKHDQDAEEAQSLSGATGNSQLTGPNRHVECADCHNVHASAPNVPHVQGTNLVSGILAGVWGVDADSTEAAWSPPSGWTTWSKKSPAAAEYQLCFKCHSATAYGSTPPAKTQVSVPGTTFWNSATYTDQSLEFNPNNASYHAVWGASKASGSGTYLNGWTATSRMYCSDCHRSSVAGDPKGSHGSATPSMLGGYVDPAAARYVTGDNDGYLYPTKAARDADFTFCFGCHDRDFAGTGFADNESENLHTMDDHLRACTNCHVAVPHGWNRAHMLYFSRGATIDSAPYNDHAGDSSFGLPSTMNIGRLSGDWQKEDCNGSGAPCHGE